jgi:outer membrane protein OmpA-like peptidoglycan-associated protein
VPNQAAPVRDRFHPDRTLVLWLSFSLAALALPAPAAAQPSGTLNRFRAGETPEDDFHLSRPTDLGHLRFGAQLHLDYALDPLVYEEVRGSSATERFSIVEHQLTANVGLSIGLFDRLVIYGGLPVTLLLEGQTDPVLDVLGVPRAEGAGLADAYLGARLRLFGEAADAGALALQVTATFPTSDVPGTSSYRGDPFLTVHPELVAEVRPGSARIVLNVGARFREETGSATGNLAFGHELTYGVGFGIPMWTDTDDRTHLDALAQIYGDTAFARFGERDGTALEATAGIRLFHNSGLVLGLAGGPGLARGFGSPDLRAILMIGWVTPRELPGPVDRDGDGLFDPDDGCPDEPEDPDAFEDSDGCPDPDNDADGILDGNDSCPNEPETVNGFEDTEGCPDEVPDTDGDGLRDDVDQCITEPEDFDGFEDENGCPDPDNDADGVLDPSDRCVMEPGPATNQGCPDPDRDSDTVVDRLDNCPDEPGTVEHHGCVAPQRVVLEGNHIEILEMVFFRTNGDQILARSNALLLNVAAVLNAHPEIPRVIVEGHTDSRGRHDRNLALSERRAQSVVRFLVERGGVSPDRLEAHGYGPDRPIVPDATTAAEHAQNRRVAFVIPEGTAGIETRETEVGSDAIDR